MRDFNQEYQDLPESKYVYDFDRIMHKYLLKALQPFLRGDGAALELGCYRGDMTEQILGYFPHVTIIEAASDLCEFVQGRFGGRITAINSTFENAHLEPAYGNVFLVHTLEHLDDPVAVLTGIRRWMAPGGRLYVAVPNANALSRQIAVRMGLMRHNTDVTPAEETHGHRRTYAADLFQYHLKSAGLRTIHSGGVLVKGLANFQFDRALGAGIVDDAYFEGCFELGKLYPDLCASLFAVCEDQEHASGDPTSKQSAN